MKIRNLKIYKRLIRGNEKHNFYKVTPEIRLQGKWLEDLGFQPNEHVQVECKQGQLIITKIE